VITGRAAVDAMVTALREGTQKVLLKPTTPTEMAEGVIHIAQGLRRAATVERHRRHMARELAGIEALDGSYPFTLERSVKAFRINDYLHRMVEPAHREAFRRDPDASFAAAGLTEEERDLIRRRDWRGLMHYGAIFFMLEKLGAVVGVSNLHIYAAMRGESLEDFQRTRNAPGALYSVAGKESGNLAWDRPRGEAR